MAKQVEINVVEKFTFRKPDGVVEFEPGLYKVDAEVADHWFVKAHLGSMKAAKAEETSTEGGDSTSVDPNAAIA